VKIDLGVFRCSNPILLISGLIASSVLINPILSISFMKNRHLRDYVLKIVISINWRFNCKLMNIFMYGFSQIMGNFVL
jgi:hypothetical protein